MRLDVDGIRAGKNEAIESLHRTCRECARIGASKVGAQMFVDDITQEMVLHVLTRFIHVYDPTRDAEPYLIDVATKMGSGMRRKTWREETAGVSEDSHEDTLPHIVDQSDSAEVQLEQEEQDARAAAARKELLARITAKRAAAGKAVGGFTQEELESVELAVAALLKKMDAAAPAPPLPRLPPRGRVPRRKTEAEEPIWQIMRTWCKKLGIDTSDDAWHVQLVEPLGVHRATLWRWRAGKTHPTAEAIRVINEIVDAHVAQAAGGAAKVAGGAT